MAVPCCGGRGCYPERLALEDASLRRCRYWKQLHPHDCRRGAAGEQPRVLLSERVVTRLSKSVVRDGRIMDEVERVAAAVAAAILSD